MAQLRVFAMNVSQIYDGYQGEPVQTKIEVETDAATEVGPLIKCYAYPVLFPPNNSAHAAYMG